MKQIIMLAYYLRAFYELSRLKALLHFQKICLHKNCIASENCVILTAHWRGCASSWLAARLHKNAEMDDSSESLGNIRVPPEKVNEVNEANTYTESVFN